MEIEIHSYPKNNNLISGSIYYMGVYSFEAKLYDEGSQFGINNGRISKLTIRDLSNNIIINYDRGWDIEPCNSIEKHILNELVDYLETARKRF